jgi:multisubunit Na+/H+ antiporter MnhG subunit
MKPTTKIYILGIVFCLIGAILADLHIFFTGAMCVVLGFLIIMIGPMVFDLLEDKK